MKPSHRVRQLALLPVDGLKAPPPMSANAVSSCSLQRPGELLCRRIEQAHGDMASSNSNRESEIRVIRDHNRRVDGTGQYIDQEVRSDVHVRTLLLALPNRCQQDSCLTSTDGETRRPAQVPAGVS